MNHLIANRFRVLREVARGGMGVVYEATDEHTGERIAVKCMLEPTFDVARFSREAELLESLAHPGLVRYVAHGEADDGYPYLAMEWLEGEELAARIARKALPLTDALVLMERVTETIGTLHARGVVHRDIKPSNIFLRHGNASEPLVLDLGIARSLGRDTQMTRTGTILGTPAYMAPEQARGERVDARADVFSLGCVFFECLAGIAPFRGAHAIAILTKILLEDPPPLDEFVSVPPAIGNIVERMLKKHPDERFVDAAEVRMALADIGHRLSNLPSRATFVSGAERRIVSFAVCMEAGDASTTSQFWAVEKEARTFVESHGGQLHLLVSGAVVVTAPQDREPIDQAVCAARCAMILSGLLGGVAFAVVTGMTDMSARMVVGETIDRAITLLADKGDSSHLVRVDEPSARLLETRFHMTTTERGRWLVREREVADHARLLLGRPTPFVGRDKEIATLLATFDECAGESVARAILVTAPAGTGKSRLLREFLVAAKKRETPVEIWVARGDSLGAGSPWAMAGQIIRSAAGIADDENLGAKIAKLVARIESFVKTNTSHVVEFLREIAGLSVPAAEASEALRAARQNPVAMGDATRAAWEQWLDAECADGARMIVLEDLHWGDRSTVQFIDSTLRNLVERPLLVMATARPEVHELFPKLWEARGVAELKLGAMSKVAAERLVKGVLGHRVDAQNLRMILERAAGHPFLLEELIRAVAEGRAQNTLPENVLGLLQVRLGILNSELRRVLRAASVFGESFWRGGLVMLLGRDDENLRQALITLEEKEFIGRRRNSRIAGEEEFGFMHALIRDVAYASLVEADCTVAHASAGEWLEMAGFEDALVLAEHYDRGRIPARAIVWYRQAAEQALDGNDPAGAIQRVERAMACGAEGEMRGYLEKIRAEAFFWRGELAAAKAFAEQAARLLPEASEAWFLAVGTLVSAAGQAGDNDAAETWGFRAASFEAATSAVDEQVVCVSQALNQIAWAYRTEASAKLYARLENLVGQDVERLGPYASGWFYRVLVAKHTHHLRVRGAYEAARKALAMFERAGARRMVCIMKVARTSVTCMFDPEQNRREIQEAIAESGRIGANYIIGLGRMFSCSFHWYRGDDEQAEFEALQLLDVFRGSPGLASAIICFLSLARAGLGKWREAYESAMDYVRNPRVRGYELAMLGVAAEASIHLGNDAEARELMVRAGELARDTSVHKALGVEGLICQSAYAAGLMAIDDRDGAREVLRPLVETIRDAVNEFTDPVERAALLSCPQPWRAIVENARRVGIDVRVEGG